MKEAFDEAADWLLSEFKNRPEIFSPVKALQRPRRFDPATLGETRCTASVSHCSLISQQKLHLHDPWNVVWDSSWSSACVSQLAWGGAGGGDWPRKSGCPCRGLLPRHPTLDNAEEDLDATPCRLRFSHP